MEVRVETFIPLTYEPQDDANFCAHSTGISAAKALKPQTAFFGPIRMQRGDGMAALF